MASAHHQLPPAKLIFLQPGLCSKAHAGMRLDDIRIEGPVVREEEAEGMEKEVGETRKKSSKARHHPLSSQQPCLLKPRLVCKERAAMDRGDLYVCFSFSGAGNGMQNLGGLSMGSTPEPTPTPLPTSNLE